MMRKLLRVKDTPRQMAAGIACGLLLGLVPKGNLLALCIASLLFSTRMSLATGMVCAFFISMIAPLCDPVTHRLGEWVLTQPVIVPLWRLIARLPFAAWTSFNNTIVMGSLVVGSILMYPVYRLSIPWMERLHRRYVDPSIGTTEIGREHTSCDGPGETRSQEAIIMAEAVDDSVVCCPIAAGPVLNVLPRRVSSDRRRSCA